MVADTLVETKADTVVNSTLHLLSSKVATAVRQVEDMVAVREVHRLLDGIKCGREIQVGILSRYSEKFEIGERLYREGEHCVGVKPIFSHFGFLDLRLSGSHRFCGSGTYVD
jgi:hypothetical protein